MPFADHDDVVKAFPANRANHPLGIRVLPRRARRNNHLSDVQHPSMTRKSFVIDLVAIPDHRPARFLRRARLEQLACRPFRRRMLRDIEMHQPAPAVGQHHEHEQDPNGRGGDREEIQREYVLRRDSLADAIKTMLANATFGDGTINEPDAKTLVQQARALLKEVNACATNVAQCAP